MNLFAIDWWPGGGAGAFLLFLLPFGPGATAGILVGKNEGLGALAIAGLYLAADGLRACYFEPLLRLVARIGARQAWAQEVADHVRQLAARTQLGSGRLGQVSSLTLLSMGGGFTIGSIAVANARVNRALGWSGVILGDVTWFCFKLAAALGLASVLPDDRLVFVCVAAIAMLAGLVARRLRGLLPAVRPAEALPGSPPR